MVKTLMSLGTPTKPKHGSQRQLGRERATSAVAWVAASFLISQVLIFVQGMFSARFLDARSLGVWGIATVFNNLYRGFMQNASPQDFVVLSTAENEQSVIHSLFYANLLRSLILATIFLLLGPGLSAIYAEPDFVGVMILFAVALALDGLRNPGLGLAFKRFDFKPMILVERGAQIVGLAVSLVMLILYHSIWAIVVPVVLARILFIMISYLYEPIRPVWKLASLSWIRRILSFSFYLTMLTVIGIGVRQGPDFLISNVDGLEIYGKYSLLYLIANIPVNGISYVIDRISFPLYSKSRGDQQQLGKLVTSVQMSIFLITGLMCIGFFVAARPLLALIPGEIWQEYTSVFQLLTLYALLRAYAASFASVCKLDNRLQSRYNLIVLAEIVFVIIIGAPILLKVSLPAYIVIMCIGLVFHIMLASWLIRGLLDHNAWAHHNTRLIVLTIIAAISGQVYMRVFPQTLAATTQIVQSALFVLVLTAAALFVSWRFGLLEDLRDISKQVSAPLAQHQTTYDG